MIINRYIKEDFKDIALLKDDIFYNIRSLKEYLNCRTKENFKKIRLSLNLNGLLTLGFEIATISFIYNNMTNVDQQTKIFLLCLSSLIVPTIKYSYKYNKRKQQIEAINHHLRKMFYNPKSENLKVYAYDFKYNSHGNLIIKFYANNVLPNTIKNEDICYCIGGKVIKRKYLNNRAFEIVLDENKNMNEETEEKPEDYLKEKNGSLERLIKIFEYLDIRFEFKRSLENDIQTIHKFRIDISKLTPNKKKEIIYKLGMKKNYLEIYNSEGLTNFVFNDKPELIYHFFDIFKNIKRPNMEIPFLFGVDPKTSKIIIKDFRKILHLLIGGRSGEGKSNTLHQLIQTLLYWNDNISAFTIDLKGTELKQYKDLSNVKHIRFDFRNEFKEFESGIDEIQKIFDDRYDFFEQSEYRDIETFNKNNPNNKLNFIFMIVDEANQFKLKLSKNEELFNKVDEITTLILRQGRSMGIHLIHTAQKVGDTGVTGYPSTWREDFTNTLSHNLKEDLTAEKFFNEKSLIYKATHLKKGEFLFYDSEKSIDYLAKSTYIPLDNKDNVILKALMIADKKKIEIIKNGGGKLINFEKKEG
mgnify:CR=1 FL=1